jgi:hypothetical protein
VSADASRSARTGRRPPAGRALLVLALGTFLLNLVVGTVRYADLPVPPGDEGYDITATRLSEEGRYENPRFASDDGRPARDFMAYRPPAFPVVLAGTYELFGRSVLSVVALQAVLAALVAVGAVGIARSMVPPTAALLVGVGTALFPYNLVHNTSLIDTTLFSAALIGALYTATAQGRSLAWRAAACGACVGVCLLTRPVSVLVLVPILVWLLRGSGRRALLVPLAVVVLLVGGWTVRNLAVLDGVVPVATNGGWNLWLGNNPDTAGYVLDGTTLDDIEYAENHDWSQLQSMGEREEDRHFRREALSWIVSDPVAFARTCLVKAFVTLVPVLRPGDTAAKAGTFFVAGAALYAFAWARVRSALRRPEGRLLAAVVAAAVVTNVLFLPYTRLVAPVFPLLFVLGAVGLQEHRRAVSPDGRRLDPRT